MLEGYYFVRFAASGEWSMGHFDGSVWRVMGSDGLYEGADFTALARLPIQNVEDVR